MIRPVFPRTRYQGSKRKLAGAIVDAVEDLDFTTVLDAFGGTGAVAYAFKSAGKAVTYNDVLSFNHQVGTAIIENDAVRLDPETIRSIGRPRCECRYADTIEREFEGIYYTREENRWLDIAVGNIRTIENRYRRAIAWFALFQAALAKRPYNLFHRRNLYMRTADVKRTFGNKTTWERSFEDHFRCFAESANASLIDSGGCCRALCRDACEIDPEFDLVYIDPPYVNRRGTGVDYRDFYHFLEGLMRYDDWPAMIDRRSRHRRLIRRPDPWSDAKTCRDGFRRLLTRFRHSVLVVSYRSDGIPAIEELGGMIRHVKGTVRVIDGPSYQYALSTNRTSREVLLIGS